MRKIITLSILLVLAIVHTTTAQTVDLNRDFNVCGSVTNSFAGNGTSFIRHSSVKSNGKVLAAGYSQTFKALFAQYHSNGNADPAFGYTP